MAQQLNTTRFDLGSGKHTKYVTAWISGERQSIEFTGGFPGLLDAVSDMFGIEIKLLRIYAIADAWSSRKHLTEENFGDYIRREGAFEKMVSRLYFIVNNVTPDGTPEKDNVDAVEGSKSSRSSNRSGQAKFIAIS